MTIPGIFYTVVSEHDGFTGNPLCWETSPLLATRLQAEAAQRDAQPCYGRTWIAEVHILSHTIRHPTHG